MDIDNAALEAIVYSLKEQAGHVHAPLQEHTDLASVLLQSIEFEYKDGMEWGFHDREINKNIAYSVSRF